MHVREGVRDRIERAELAGTEENFVAFEVDIEADRVREPRAFP
jgi:hypothetical protein